MESSVYVARNLGAIGSICDGPPGTDLAPAPDLDLDLEAVMARAAAALAARQRLDGSWNTDTDIGPIGMATQLLTEALFGALPPEDRRPAVRYFEGRQLADGSFPAHPHSDKGSVTVTALAVAAMDQCGGGAAGAVGVADRARAFVQRHGGLPAVARAFRERGDIAALYLLAHGRLDVELLPALPPGIALAPLGLLLDRRVHAGNVLFMLVLAALLDRARTAPGGLLASARRALEQVRIREALTRWQNADGSWNGSPLQTTTMLLGLHAVGMGPGDACVARALAWLDGMKRRGDGLDVCAMDNDVWSTALAAMALRAAGEPAAGDTLRRAYAYLLACQSRMPMPVENQRRPGARRTGGWPFQRGNDHMPDTDDTGVVLAALAEDAGERAPREVFRAIDEGVAWLRDMQNPDGGFPTFVWGLPSKPPGPIFLRDLRVALDDPRAIVGSLVRPEPEYGDPALEGVTGRVLWGLGATGVRREDPAVCRAIDFLRSQQCDSGAWWGRWKACYLAETATVLIGLGAVGEDMRADHVQRALRFMLRCQNDDGGFGETPAAYRDPQCAGQGPSMPAVTAYVVLGILAVEAAPLASAVIERAIAYLVRTQRDDGLWDNAGWLHTFVPPDLMYVYEAPAHALPLLAIAGWRGRQGR